MYNNNFPGNQPDEQDLYDSVSYLQSNLRQLSYHDDDIPEVGIDGIFGDETRSSLMSFQQKYGVEPTGIADINTWELLRDAADDSREFHSPPEAIKIFPRLPEDYLWDGNSSSIQIQILQYVLDELETEYGYEEIPITGIYDDPTQNAVSTFQQKNGLSVTGKVDRLTWNKLARQYNTIIDRSNR